MKAMILCLLITASASGQVWQRHVQSGKGDSFDTPTAHPLAYFTRGPFLRDDGDDDCADCTPAGKAEVHTQHKFTTEVRRVGELHGFAIYDVFYRFDDHVDTGEIDWKSILVQVAPGRFREIYHLQPTAALIEPSFFLKSASEEILATRDLIPGTGNYSYEDYFWFSSAGAVRIDTGAINKAVQSVLPAGSAIWKGGGLDMTAPSYHSSVWKEGDANCCPSGGSVDVKFRLDRDRVIVTSTHFTPPSEEATEGQLQR
jgi:hypothetical protein